MHGAARADMHMQIVTNAHTACGERERLADLQDAALYIKYLECKYRFFPRRLSENVSAAEERTRRDLKDDPSRRRINNRNFFLIYFNVLFFSFFYLLFYFTSPPPSLQKLITSGPTLGFQTRQNYNTTGDGTR